MAETTGISWTDHTMNFWWGCQKIGPGCDRCYAETLDHRLGGSHWGPEAERRRTSAHNWNNPLRWNRAAKRAGVRRRVFASSMADFFDNQVNPAWRADAWDVIRTCPDLDWQVLTKRPGNVVGMLPPDWGDGWPHVLLGCTVVNQAEADRDVPKLLATPAQRRFLSCEPLLGPIRFAQVPGFNRIGLDLSGWWIIVGGESGPGARPMAAAWARDILSQCAVAGVPVFFKQTGSGGLDAWPGVTGKGDKPEEWPAWAQVQQFPRSGAPA